MLIIKTEMTIPYTSIFFELGCGYWTARSGRTMRKAMAAAANTAKIAPESAGLQTAMASTPPKHGVGDPQTRPRGRRYICSTKGNTPMTMNAAIAENVGRSLFRAGFFRKFVSQQRPGRTDSLATRESLQAYQIPDWFRDAKFGIWSHWGPQSAIEDGDWYARNMYIQGRTQYLYHCETYGHPSKVGYKDLVNNWKADKWDPDT